MSGKYVTTYHHEPELELEIEGILYPAEPDVGIFSSFWDNEDITQLTLNGEVFKSADLPPRFWKALIKTLSLDEILQDTL